MTIRPMIGPAAFLYYSLPRNSWVLRFSGESGNLRYVISEMSARTFVYIQIYHANELKFETVNWTNP